ncbi:Flp family type IVb pilin [Paraburkholderia panacisoli]|uniref:Flp family type IVb pilin n=1 Tax=Paraburkholderia panacisoli TaxID=2603818 RepID=A0A5B0HHK7_9BURK|nr:Flp family type IVb pilin [Paraburkholderia panacisoli]KAA1014580.1 Flp family type IVb pilin [Paraburkholderia panacisoli]
MRKAARRVALLQSLRIDAARIKRFVSDEQGVTAIEYGLIASLIAVVIIGAVTLVGTDLNAVFTTIGNDL